jgi:hypothetical protein
MNEIALKRKTTEMICVLYLHAFLMYKETGVMY